MKKASLILLAMLLLVALLVGCDGDAPQPNQPTETDYAVLVQTASGLPLGKIRIQVYENATKLELVAMGMTDDNGNYSFTAPTGDGYVAVLEKVPESLEVGAEYPLAGEMTTISLSAKTIDDALMDSAKLAVGDMMMDFSVTDCEGTEYKLSELLKEKKAVVLNFWYLNCEPCKMEFPFVQEAYEACGEDAAFLGMNCVDGNDEKISAFKAENNLTFSLSACDARWQTVMNLTAYPTTLIIDRYGYIVASHRGMFTESAELISALEYITADGYQHEIFDSIGEVPSTDGV